MKAMLATTILLAFLLQSSLAAFNYKCAFLNNDGYYDFTTLASKE